MSGGSTDRTWSDVGLCVVARVTTAAQHIRDVMLLALPMLGLFCRPAFRVYRYMQAPQQVFADSYPLSLANAGLVRGSCGCLGFAHCGDRTSPSRLPLDPPQPRA